MEIQVPITIKIVVTELFLQNLFREIEQKLVDIESQLNRLDYEAMVIKKGLALKSGDFVEGKLKAIEQEIENLVMMKEHLLANRKESEGFQMGSEIVHSQINGLVKIKPGDNWQVKTNPEIIIEDGIIKEIRG